jgi:hypothetical protein
MRLNDVRAMNSFFDSSSVLYACFALLLSAASVNRYWKAALSASKSFNLALFEAYALVWLKGNDLLGGP